MDADPPRFRGCLLSLLAAKFDLVKTAYLSSLSLCLVAQGSLCLVETECVLSGRHSAAAGPGVKKMVKAYLRYEHAAAFGVISSGCNVLYDASGKQLFTGALENIAIWNIRQGSLVSSSSSSCALCRHGEVTASTQEY